MDKRTIDKAMKDLSMGAKEVYGNKLREVILFGSCARDDFDDESDIDVMILLNVDKFEVANEREKIRAVIHRLDRQYEYELLFSTIVQSGPEFDYWLETLPFYKNIKKEGIRYA
ncbi:MAG: nucleotidyltransferase domain-containing protein [Lachnospiraceae bacterium]|nr:nucleotidyltransferase domain-containing protein [Lachnospiraceae bacterium]